MPSILELSDAHLACYMSVEARFIRGEGPEVQAQLVENALACAEAAKVEGNPRMAAMHTASARARLTAFGL